MADRQDYARMITARARLQIAIDQQSAARAEVSVVIGEHHDVVRAISDALLKDRIAAARLDDAIRALSRIPEAT